MDMDPPTPVAPLSPALATKLPPLALVAASWDEPATAEIDPEIPVAALPVVAVVSPEPEPLLFAVVNNMEDDVGELAVVICKCPETPAAAAEPLFPNIISPPFTAVALPPAIVMEPPFTAADPPFIIISEESPALVAPLVPTES
jgi:hypothetical protein